MPDNDDTLLRELYIAAVAAHKLSRALHIGASILRARRSSASDSTMTRPEPVEEHAQMNLWGPLEAALSDRFPSGQEECDVDR